METAIHTLSAARRRALLALWAIPGLGPKGLARLAGPLDGQVEALLPLTPAQWTQDLPLTAVVRRRLVDVPSLEFIAERVEARLAKSPLMKVVFPYEEGFPERLVGLEDGPPLLFMMGAPSGAKRRLAMVGSRHPEQGFLPWARTFARDVAAAGVGVVSGAAQGVDRACHWGALDAGGQTWAFLGSALDVLDSAQAKLLPHFLAAGGVFYSELPPGVRASTTTFPRRNRLIAGASDAVLVMRAGVKSGSLHTALAALTQGRTLLALPGDVTNPLAEGANALLWTGHARLCRGVGDVLEAVGMRSSAGPATAPDMSADASLSEGAKVAYGALARAPRSFDEVRQSCRLSPAQLTSALCELELLGLALQHPGRQFERV